MTKPNQHAQTAMQRQSIFGKQHSTVPSPIEENQTWTEVKAVKANFIQESCNRGKETPI